MWKFYKGLEHDGWALCQIIPSFAKVRLVVCYAGLNKFKNNCYFKFSVGTLCACWISQCDIDEM